jgi:hypothetical protein
MEKNFKCSYCNKNYKIIDKVKHTNTKDHVEKRKLFIIEILKAKGKYVNKVDYKKQMSKIEYSYSFDD